MKGESCSSLSQVSFGREGRRKISERGERKKFLLVSNIDFLWKRAARDTVVFANNLLLASEPSHFSSHDDYNHRYFYKTYLIVYKVVFHGVCLCSTTCATGNIDSSNYSVTKIVWQRLRNNTIYIYILFSSLPPPPPHHHPPQSSRTAKEGTTVILFRQRRRKLSHGLRKCICQPSQHLFKCFHR